MAPTIKQYVHNVAAHKRIPVSGTFELTPRCNFDCRMCYIRMSPEEQRRVAPERDTAWWLDIGRQAVEGGMIYLLLTGGEPFLRPDFVTIYTEMVKMGVLVSVNTNAACLTDEILDAFRKHPPEAVNITLYGASPETYGALCGVRGGYEQAVRGIDALRAAGVRVYLNTTFTACNIGDMEALIAFAHERKLPIRTSGYTFPPTRNGHEACDVCLSPDEQARLNARFEFLTADPANRPTRRAQLASMRETFVADRDKGSPVSEEGLPVTCLAGRGAFWLAWTGEMYPCGMLSGQATRGANFAAMWREVRDMTASLRLPAVCRDCAFRSLCPSCAAVSYTNHGDTAAHVAPLCRYMEVFADTYIGLVDATEEATEAAVRVTVDTTTPTVDGEEGTSTFVCL